jgi:hypothetical protein
MPCQTVTIQAPDTTNIQFQSHGVEPGTNSATVNYSLINTGNTAGTVDVKITVDGVEQTTTSYTVYPDTNRSDSVTLSFSLDQDTDMNICSKLV